jgi:serine/threonine protein kinase
LQALNVLLQSSTDSPKGFTAKVADFGLSVKMLHTETHVSNMFQGTITHMAPETMLTGQQSNAADV